MFCTSFVRLYFYLVTQQVTSMFSPIFFSAVFTDDFYIAKG